ncbi:transporter substrate-binding domain-containing protein (plasmid) [Sphingobium sp. SJ10-10]|uniref:substrate-binding periplasmic protein n=1 Tax=Sphingobium sp. SJ10-10 TaxID=3114999 RepID=UPI002E1915F0|nr:transporter substrate-binding domain-containing protein [Sphingobium sp. SJ10-10]
MISRRSLLGGAGAAVALGLLPGMTHAAPLGKVKELGVLRVVVYKDNRPWSWEEGGKLVGLDVDLAHALAAKLGVRADVAELVADESVDDDLRHGVWKGGLLGFAPGDLMLHIPFDRTFAARNDQVAIVAPYYRESFRFAGTQNAIDLEAPPTGWRGHRLAAELDSIPDFYLIGSFGGILAKDVAHYPSGSDAVTAVAAGKADAVLASRAQIEEGLHREATKLTVRKGPLPAFTSPGWDIGMAVKENSRTLGDAVEEIVSTMAASGEMKALFAPYGVEWTPALAAG